MTVKTLQHELDKFREAYHSTKCNQYDDSLLYVLPFFYNAEKAARQANELIENMGLNLVAIHSGRNSFFEIKSNEVEL